METSDSADEVTLSRKGAKSQPRVRGLRSTETKARTHVERLRAANADLKKKLAEALEQQTATSEVLRIISSSPGELEPVFEALLANAMRICEAKFGALYLCEGDVFRTAALHNAAARLCRSNDGADRYSSGSGARLVRATRTRQAVQIADLRQTRPIRSDPLTCLIDLAGIRTPLSFRC